MQHRLRRRLFVKVLQYHHQGLLDYLPLRLRHHHLQHKLLNLLWLLWLLIRHFHRLYLVLGRIRHHLHRRLRHPPESMVLED